MSGCGQRGSGHNVNLILITIDTLRAEAFATDQFIGDLVAQLEKLELADDTIIAVVSDHGEYLQEHGLTNRHGLYDEVLHVPMFIHWRGLSKTERRHGTVSTIDQAPALLDMRGVAKMSSAQGHRLGKRGSGHQTTVFAEWRDFRLLGEHEPRAGDFLVSAQDDPLPRRWLCCWTRIC